MDCHSCWLLVGMVERCHSYRQHQAMLPLVTSVDVLLAEAHMATH